MSNVNKRVIKNSAKPIEPPVEEAEEQKKVKYCPFKKAVDAQYNQISETNTDLIPVAEIENFRECIKELCMAYSENGCLLIKK